MDMSSYQQKRSEIKDAIIKQSDALESEIVKINQDLNVNCEIPAKANSKSPRRYDSGKKNFPLAALRIAKLKTDESTIKNSSFSAPTTPITAKSASEVESPYYTQKEPTRSTSFGHAEGKLSLMKSQLEKNRKSVKKLRRMTVALWKSRLIESEDRAIISSLISLGSEPNSSTSDTSSLSPGNSIMSSRRSSRAVRQSSFRESFYIGQDENFVVPIIEETMSPTSKAAMEMTTEEFWKKLEGIGRHQPSSRRRTTCSGTSDSSKRISRDLSKDLRKLSVFNNHRISISQISQGTQEIKPQLEIKHLEPDNANKFTNNKGKPGFLSNGNDSHASDFSESESSGIPSRRSSQSFALPSPIIPSNTPPPSTKKKSTPQDPNWASKQYAAQQKQYLESKRRASHFSIFHDSNLPVPSTNIPFQRRMSSLAHTAYTQTNNANVNDLPPKRRMSTVYLANHSTSTNNVNPHSRNRRMSMLSENYRFSSFPRRNSISSESSDDIAEPSVGVLPFRERRLTSVHPGVEKANSLYKANMSAGIERSKSLHSTLHPKARLNQLEITRNRDTPDSFDNLPDPFEKPYVPTFVPPFVPPARTYSLPSSRSNTPNDTPIGTPKRSTPKILTNVSDPPTKAASSQNPLSPTTIISTVGSALASLENSISSYFFTAPAADIAMANAQARFLQVPKPPDPQPKPARGFSLLSSIFFGRSQTSQTNSSDFDSVLPPLESIQRIPFVPPERRSSRLSIHAFTPTPRTSSPPKFDPNTEISLLPIRPSSRKRRNSKKQKRRQSISSAEFYDADFSLPASEAVANSAAQGLNRSESMKLQPTDDDIRRASIAMGVPLHTALSIAAAVVSDTQQENDVQTDVNLEKQGTVFIAALNSITVDKSREEISQQETQQRNEVETKHQQDHVLKEGLPGVNTADMFSKAIGRKAGIEIFRIEGFKPVPVLDNMFGVFSLGDCYIILVSRWNWKSVTDDEGEDDDMAIKEGWVRIVNNVHKPLRIVGQRVKRRVKKEVDTETSEDELTTEMSDENPTHGEDPPELVGGDEDKESESESDDLDTTSESNYSEYEDSEYESEEYITEDDEFDEEESFASTGSRTLCHQIFTWIGPSAELDKRFCSAMYAVALRNYLGSSTRIERAALNDESLAFRKVFSQFEPASGGKKIESLEDESEDEMSPNDKDSKSVLRYVDVNAAAESSLYVQDNDSDDFDMENETSKRKSRRTVKLYRVVRGVAGRDIKLRLCEPAMKSLTPNSVCIIDTGKEVVQWNGGNAGLNLRSKCRILISKMVGGGSKKGIKVSGEGEETQSPSVDTRKIKSFEFDEGGEPLKFWNLLGEDTIPSSQDFYLAVSTQSETDVLYRDISDKPGLLYQVSSDLNQDPSSHLIAIESTDLQPPSISTKSSISLGLKRSLLNSSSCYILDAGVEMFLWNGMESSLQTRASARELLARIVSLQSRPNWIGLHRLIEGHENEVFKIRFADWVPPPPSRTFLVEGVVDDSDVEDATNRRKRKEPMKVDVKALYQTQSIQKFTEFEEEVENAITHANSLLVTMSCFVYKRALSRFVRMPDSDIGHFFETDAYVFLCVYHQDSEIFEEEEPQPLTVPTLPTGKKSVTSTRTLEPVLSEDEAVKEEEAAEDVSEGNVSDVSPSKPTPSAPPLPEKFIAMAESQVPAIVKTVDDIELDSDVESEAQEDHSVENSRNSSPTRSIPRAARAFSVSSTKSSRATNNRRAIASKVECVVYFWQGLLAPRLALSTFKFKTQVELESLVQNMYGCPVHIVHLEPGNEPIKFLAHLSNMLIIHRNDDRSEGGENKNVLGHGGAQAAKEIEGALGLRKSRFDSNSCRLFHIRTDRKLITTRAVEVVPVLSSLVSRDCFFVLASPNDSGNAGYLWIGKCATPVEANLAQSVANMIAKRRIEQVGLADSAEINSLELFSTVEEGTEPAEFWKLLESLEKTIGIGSLSTNSSLSNRYARGCETYQIQPRFFQCSASSGIFAVTEISDFRQTDLVSETCVILDPTGGALMSNVNFESRNVFVWVGKSSSDVVRKLTRKSVEVWFRNLNDGRVVGRSGWWEASKRNSLVSKSGTSSRISVRVGSAGSNIDKEDESDEDEGDVVWIMQGFETVEFRAFFHGWWWDPRDQETKSKRTIQI
ncbi:hypothetical protein HK098_001605 [Nowakowskiella sp. JEL0407]|nr:hypothetical protein HK098_001605 [Nowakowskiella sp. JEL0407]